METAACHCQQSAEKLLKALLVAAARPTRKTHDLDELPNAVAEVHPDLSLLADRCQFMTRWGFVIDIQQTRAAYHRHRRPDRDQGAQAILADLRGAIAARDRGESS